jgi:hypothetical protein
MFLLRRKSDGLYKNNRSYWHGDGEWGSIEQAQVFKTRGGARQARHTTYEQDPVTRRWNSLPKGEWDRRYEVVEVELRTKS